MHISTYNRSTLRSVIVAFVAVLALLSTSFSPLALYAQDSTTITPLGSLVDGDVVKTADHHDVYIIKIIGVGTSNQKRFKRLIINPDIFESYGHLEWSNIKTVTQATLNAFTLSDLVMEVNADGTPVNGNIYRLYATESDAGLRSHLQFTPAQFEAAGLDWDSVFYVNHIEGGEEFYEAAAPIVTHTHLITHSHLPAGTTFAVAPAPLGSSGEVTVASTTTPQPEESAPSPGTTTPPDQPRTRSDQPPPPTEPDQPPPPTEPTLPAEPDGGSNTGGGSFAVSIIDDDLDAPSNFRASNSGITSSTLSWRRVSGATGYEIQWCSDSCSSSRDWGSKYTITNSSTTRHTIQGLAPYTTYKVRIRSFKGRAGDDVSKWRNSIITNLGQGFDISLYMVGQDTKKLYKVHPSTGAATQLDGVFPNYILRTWIDYIFRPELSGGRAVSGQPDEIRPSHYDTVIRSSIEKYDITTGGFGLDTEEPSGLVMAPDGSFFLVETWNLEGYLYRLDPITYQARLYGTQEDGLGDAEYAFSALAFSPDGVLYGVGENDWLYKFVGEHYHPTRGAREECNIGGRQDDPDRCSPNHNLTVEIERVNSWSEYTIDGKGTSKGFVDPQTAPYAPELESTDRLNPERNPTGLAFVGDQLYMVGDDNDRLYTINKETGEGFPITDVQGFGQNIDYPLSLTAVGDTLYMGVVPTTNTPTQTSLYTVDPTTGLATPVDIPQGFGVGESQPTGLVAVATPLAPTNVVGVPASTTSISLSWTAPPKATEYEIQYCEVHNSQCGTFTDSTFSAGQWRTSGTTSQTSYTITTGLEADKAYRVRVGNKKSGYPIGWKLTPNIKTYTPINTEFYVVDNSTDKLYTFNLATGAFTEVGGAGSQTAGFGMGETTPAGLEMSPDGVLYLLGGQTDKLYTLNKETGVATAVHTGSEQTFGANVSETAPGDLAFSPDGVLYMVGNDSGTTGFRDSPTLYTLNTSAGVATAVTNLDAPIKSVDGLEFIGNTLYGTGRSGTGDYRLWTINPTTGAVTAVDPDLVNGFGTESRNPSTGQLTAHSVTGESLTTVGNTLYMGTTTLTFGNDILYTVNTNTGRATAVELASNNGGLGTTGASLKGIVAHATTTPPSFTRTIDSTKNSITIAWDPVTDAETYAIRHCVASSCTWSEAQTTTDTIHTITGLSSSTSYKIGVGVDRQSEGYEIKWTEHTASTSPTSPAFGLSVTSTELTRIGVSWNTVTGASGYAVQYCVAQSNGECDENGWLRGGETNSSTTTLSLSYLKPNTQYRVRVGKNPSATSTNRRIVSYWSEPISAQTEPEPISFNFGTEGIPDTSITINWIPASDATGYKVQHCAISDCPTWTDSASIPTSDMSYTITGLDVGETYEVRLGKQVSGGTMEWSAPGRFTTYDRVYAFSLDRYADPVQNSVGLAVIFHTTYGAPQRDYTARVQYCEIADISVSDECAGPWTHAGDVPPTRHLFPVQYLNAETYYNVRVGKIRSDGRLYWIQEKTISTPERPHNQPIQKVTGRRVSLVTTTSIILTWNAQSYATYDVHYCAASDCPTWTELTASSNYITVNELQPNTEYRFRIRARRSVVREGQAQDLTVGGWRSSTFNVTTSPTQ